MKRKSKKQADEFLDEFIEDEPTEEPEAEEKTKKTDTQPLDTETYVKFVKCVYSGPVNVRNAPSGQEYLFQPGQTLPVRNADDYHYLLSLKRNPGPGCCSGSPYEPTMYFDTVSFDKEV